MMSRLKRFSVVVALLFNAFTVRYKIYSMRSRQDKIDERRDAC